MTNHDSSSQSANLSPDNLVPDNLVPDYVGLVRFLVEPFLESPESLRVDCEVAPNKPRVWVRLAFEGTDKGRVFGRGGRNIQAIRTVLQAAAQSVGKIAHLDVYGSDAAQEQATKTEDKPNRKPVSKPEVKSVAQSEPTSSLRPTPLPKPVPKLRTQ
ncbi:MAG: KH domain-containing protein [Leptolyngbyaceae bacterium]|nr:KH domain-containing protein [Leptolyngbyaceae bacterium]